MNDSKYPAPERGERRVYYVPPESKNDPIKCHPMAFEDPYIYCPYIPTVPKGSSTTGTEFEAREGYRARIEKDKSDQDQ